MIEKILCRVALNYVFYMDMLTFSEIIAERLRCLLVPSCSKNCDLKYHRQNLSCKLRKSHLLKETPLHWKDSTEDC